MATKANKEAAPAVAATVSTTTPAPDLQSTLEEELKLPCAREYFYQLALTAWAYCRSYRLLFVEESDRYTDEFIDDQVEFINTVKSLPDLAILNAAATEANDDLAAWRQQVGSLAKRLGNAIDYTFKNPATAAAERQLAGLNDFSAPSSEPWAQVDTFLTKANNYLTAKLSVLVAAKGTTANLSTKFTDATTGFREAWAEFILKEKKVTDGVGQLKKGLLDILAELNPMLNDGKNIFEFDATNRKKFTVTELVKEVRGTHPAGLEGYVRNEQERGIEGVLVAVDGNPEKFAITDKKGKYAINLAAGPATFSYTMEGMVPQSITRKLTAGVTSRQNVVLLPLVLAPLVSQPVEEEQPVPKTATSPATTNEELSDALSDIKVHSPSTNGAASTNGVGA